MPDFGQNIPEQRRRVNALIDAESTRRISLTFTFQGSPYDFDPVSKIRVTGAGSLAGFAKIAGAEVGDFYWNEGTQPFVWIAGDNSIVPMDAPTCFAFAQAAAEHERAHVFAAKLLKTSEPIPSDWRDDAHWPAT